MRRFRACVFLLIILLYCSCFSAEVFQGTIYPANNSSYPETLLPRLKEAEKSIYMIMFLARRYTSHPDSPTNLFMAEMIEAKKRGAEVKVILNISDSDLTAGNMETAHYLAKNGIKVYLDSPSKSTHAKLLIIDRKYVVIGSANWTYYGMARNNEASVIIDSPKLAKFYTGYFEEIKKTCLRLSP